MFFVACTLVSRDVKKFFESRCKLFFHDNDDLREPYSFCANSDYLIHLRVYHFEYENVYRVVLEIEDENIKNIKEETEETEARRINSF